MAMPKRTIHLEQEQEDRLRELREITQVPIAAMIRRGVELAIIEYNMKAEALGSAGAQA